MQGLDSKQCPFSLPHKEIAKEHSKGRSAGVHFRPRTGNEGSRCPRVPSAEKPRGESGSEQRCEKGRGLPKQPPSTRPPGERGEDTSRAAVSCPQHEGHRKPSQQQDMPPKAKGVPQKRHIQEVRGRRCSPAGSSRPGSAREVGMHTGPNPLHHRMPRNRAAHDKPTGDNSDLPPSTEELQPQARELRTATPSGNVLVSKETQPAALAVTAQSVNIDLLPVELRLQIIQRERNRKELFRRKNKAATVIQRAWRR